jgi:hypothetical protein
MTLAAPGGLPGVTTRATRSRLAEPPTATASMLAVGADSRTPSSKRARIQSATPSTAAAPVPSNMAFEQWLDDVANVDISLSISVGSRPPIPDTDENVDNEESSVFSVSIPTMLTRVLQSKLAIDPGRLNTRVNSADSIDCDRSDVFVALSVKGRDEPIEEAIAGGLTPRKAFLRTAPHISRVASRLQDCMRQVFGMRDFVVKVD